MSKVWNKIKELQKNHRVEFLKIEIPESPIFGYFTKEELQLMIDRMEELEEKQRFLKKSKEKWI